jgi:hypothetical protein
MHTPEREPHSSDVQQHLAATDRGHESSDVPVKPLLLSLAAFAAGCLIAMWVMRAMFRSFDASARSRDVPGHVLAEEHQIPPPPKLEANPTAENEESAVAERKLLDTYGWIDRDAGIVRVPVERALELVLQEGLPARAKAR